MQQMTKRVVCALMALVVVVGGAVSAGAKPSAEKNLPQQYKHWLDEEVTYIISGVERKQFLTLTSDLERDKFIQQFWDVRNPDPAGGGNSYKEEHYKRLAYANSYFGSRTAQDGWSTDQGRIYITLGPPQQRMKYLAQRNLRPMEVWFYQSPTPVLPPHFYVVFYKPSDAEPFELYSPYQDGPTKLVTGVEAINNPKTALRIISDVLGREIAHVALSLLPTEPSDVEDFTPSLQSDQLLSSIKGLADNALNKQYIEEMKNSERVTASLMNERNQTDLQTAVIRDGQGRLTLSYLARNRMPDTSLVGARADGTQGYSFTVRGEVETAEGKFIYRQEDKLTGAVSVDARQELEHKIFAAEGRLPLAPGTYRIRVTTTNDLNHEATVAVKNVTVAEPAPGTLKLSELVAYHAPAPVMDSEDKLPFSYSGVRFTPVGAGTAVIHAGDKLAVVYQLWMPPFPKDGVAKGAVAVERGKTVHVHYVWGDVAAVGGETPAFEDEDVDVTNVDAAGNLLTGRTLDTALLTAGHYRLVVKATDDTAKQSAFATLSFEVVSTDVPATTWTVRGAGPAKGHAEEDVKRGQCAAATGRRAAAEGWYRLALRDDVNYQPALTALAQSLSAAGDGNGLADLSKAGQKAAEPQTAVLIATALRKLGRGRDAIQYLTAQMAAQAPSAAMERALADAYDEQGDHARAEQMRGQAKQLE